MPIELSNAVSGIAIVAPRQGNLLSQAWFGSEVLSPDEAAKRRVLESCRSTKWRSKLKWLSTCAWTRLGVNLRGEEMSESTGRVAKFLGLAERRLAAREAALSADGLEQRFEKSKLFGDDDDHAFRPPYGYY